MWQLMCTLLLYGGGEASRVAINMHITQYGGGEPSRVAHVCHVWQLTRNTCEPHVNLDSFTVNAAR